MIDGELKQMSDNAIGLDNLLEVSQKFLVDIIFSDLSFAPSKPKSDDVEKELSSIFEYSTPTKDEIKKVLDGNNQNIEDCKVTLINNQRKAFNHIVDMIKNDLPMNENNLKDLHQIIMTGISDIGGLYRNVDISIVGSNHTPPSHIKVYDRMKKYFDKTQKEPENNIIEHISYCHLQLAKIHPFLDGNGRAARAVLNYHLMRNGFFPVYIKQEDHKEYFECLEEFKVNKNIKPFMKFLEKLENSVSK